MNQRQFLILAYLLYIIPIPFIWWFGFIISMMATEHREEHIKSIKVFLWVNLALVIAIIIAEMIGTLLIILPIVIYYYYYMINCLLKAIELKDEAIELKDEAIELKD